jgi:hypothetical protein
MLLTRPSQQPALPTAAPRAPKSVAELRSLAARMRLVRRSELLRVVEKTARR